MNRSALLGAALSLALAASASAPAMAADARLVARPYNPNEVVRIEGRIGVQASIAFAEDEHIENVAIGDSTTWQVTPNKRANLLFVKPLAPQARTNMTVVTDRRTYFFDLTASTGARPVYVLRFTYPDEPRTGPRNATATQAPLTSAEEQALASPPSDQSVDPATLNFAWRTRGKTALLPSRIYDDGVSTYVSWPVGTPIPAIQVRDDAGTEGPVNFAVRGDVIVIDGVPKVIILRTGRDFATLENNAPPRKAPSGAELAAAPQTTPAKAE